MKVSDRDKKLLLIVIIAIIVFGAWKLFGIFDEALTENEKTLKAKNERYTDLVVKSANRKQYLDDTSNFDTQRLDLLNSYNANLSQEQTLVFLGMVEYNTGVWLKQVGFSEISTVYTFGNVSSSNPGKSSGSVYSTDYVGIKTSMTLAYECSYDGLKDVLKYLEKFGKKATISNISFAYAETSDTVSGTMTMTLYAIKGSDREFTNPTISDVAVGTDNLFVSDTFVPNGIDDTYKDRIINDYDMYLIMNQPGSDMSTMALGLAKDPSNETAVTSNSTGIENIEIIVSGRDGEYKVSYKIGGNIYPEENYIEGAPLVCGDTLDMLMISKPRTAKDDVIANVYITNKSDMQLNVAIINDDEEEPRIHIQQKDGNIVFYK